MILLNKQIQCDICGKWFSIKGIGSHKWRAHGDGINFQPMKPGHVPWNKGLTKSSSEAVRRQAESLRRHRSELEIKLDDDGKLMQKWRNKCVNALQENIHCFLTFEEFCQLVDNAGLVSSQLGYTGQGYVLARFNDQGDYTVNNCRFILQSENSSEKISHMQFTRILCVEDKLQFNSVSEAAKYYEVNESTIFSCMKTQKPILRINKTFKRI